MRTTETDSSELWLMIRPMPDPTMERCPGSGCDADVTDGALLVCPECAVPFGVWPPNTMPEHSREKRP